MFISLFFYFKIEPQPKTYRSFKMINYRNTINPVALPLEQVNALLEAKTLPYGTESHHNSTKYKLCSTKKIINTFLDKGFQVRQMSHQGAKLELRPYTKHVVRFIRDDLKIEGEGYIEILMRNSHDGTSPVKLDLGFYRLVCSNGLVVGKTFFTTIPLRHIGADFYHDLNTNIDRIVAQADNFARLISSMKSTILTNDQVFDLTRQIAFAALSNIDNLESIDYRRSFRPVRQADQDNTLWAVFNRLQERAINGGIKFKTSKIDDVTGEIYFKNNTSKRIRSISKNVELNTMLFDQALKLVA